MNLLSLFSNEGDSPSKTVLTASAPTVSSAKNRRQLASFSVEYFPEPKERKLVS